MMIDLNVRVVSSGNYHEENTPVNLNNGDIIALRFGTEKVSYFMVSSFAEHTKMGYCSLVNLQNGGKSFPEPCSRKTTIGRILNHFNENFGPNSYEGFRQFKVSQYSMNLTLTGDGYLTR